MTFYMLWISRKKYLPVTITVKPMTTCYLTVKHFYHSCIWCFIEVSLALPLPWVVDCYPSVQVINICLSFCHACYVDLNNILIMILNMVSNQLPFGTVELPVDTVQIYSKNCKTNLQ